MQKPTAKSFDEVQSEILASAPEHFALSDPPSIAWWKAKLGLNLASVAFLHHYQSNLGLRVFRHDGVFWAAKRSFYWQADSGITPRQWEGVKDELGDAGTKLLTFCVGQLGDTKGVFIRPSDRFLAVFGISLSTYDAVSFLDYRTGLKLTGARGAQAAAAAAKPVSEEELDALTLWDSRGGLGRLWHAEHLAKLLAAHQDELT
jgi:hypothetical protein